MVDMLVWLSFKITHKLNDNAWLFSWALIFIVGLFQWANIMITFLFDAHRGTRSWSKCCSRKRPKSQRLMSRATRPCTSPWGPGQRASSRFYFETRSTVSCSIGPIVKARPPITSTLPVRKLSWDRSSEREGTHYWRAFLSIVIKNVICN